MAPFSDSIVSWRGLGMRFSDVAANGDAAAVTDAAPCGDAAVC